MTIPYLPGWWDEISKSATSFVSQLPQFIQPDAVANKRLQELIQQNPMLLSQIENMTPEARIAMEQTLGFKKQSPLQKLPVGAELKRRQEDDAFLSGAQGEVRNRAIARRLGTITEDQLKKEDLKFQQDLETGELQRQVLTGQVKDINRVQAQVDSAAAKYPTLQGINIRDVAKSAVRGGQQVDPQLMTAIQSDVGAKALYDAAYTGELNLFKTELDKQLAKTKSPETQGLLLRTLTEIGNQLNDQEMRMAAEMMAREKLFEETSMLTYLGNNEAKQKAKEKELAPYMKRLEEIRKAAAENTARTTQLVTSMGLPQIPQAPQAPANETQEQRLARLRRAAGIMP